MDLTHVNVVTVVFVLAALAGAIVTVVEPTTLSFEDYLTKLSVFGGALGIGRGIAAAGRHS
jgi:hypothetical protein